jgi:hypothetical protein
MSVAKVESSSRADVLVTSDEKDNGGLVVVSNSKDIGDVGRVP